MKRFNIRVYGLVLYNGHALVTDEIRGEKHMTKFPGGGLEWGEGIKDCLCREFAEELGQEPAIENLFYVTDYFQQSAFREEDQLISIYYTVKLPWPDNIPVADEVFAFEEPVDGAQTFRWIPLKTLDPDHFTYPVDQLVARMLREEDNSMESVY
ncbi:MAG: ADP-ribose pyrophosphatase [Bacteroidetes bacterium]|nr:MAG: ADP-ribose pyrophosphatase [Bacteroidota bacterium]